MRKSLILFLGLSLGFGQSTHATLTLYKDGFALIKQPVAWQIEQGNSTIHYDLLPTGIVEDSPFLSLSGATVSMQRYNRKLFNFDRYLSDFLGEKVSVKLINEKAFKGKLMEITPGNITLQWKREVASISRNRIEYISAPGLVENPTLKRSLSWNVYSKTPQGIRGGLIYLSRGFDWDAVYRLILDPDKNNAELISDAVVSNYTNLNFSKLRLQLVEGQLKGPSTGAPPRLEMMRVAQHADQTTPKEKQLGDYHIYTLNVPLSLNGGESVTTRLYDSKMISFDKTYLFENNERSQKQEPLAVEYVIANTKKNQLGVPLPQGKIQLFQQTSDGHIEYVGEDHMGQVPTGESAIIESGRAFDVIGKRTVLNYDRQRKSEEATISLEIKNNLIKNIDVRIIEHIFGDWVVRDASENYIKKDASTIHFPLKLKPNKSQTITYTYRKEWQ